VLLGIVDRITGAGKWQVVHRAKSLPTLEVQGAQSLIVAVGLKQSWRMSRILASTHEAVTRGRAR
jgi:hypothetical protein